MLQPRKGVREGTLILKEDYVRLVSDADILATRCPVDYACHIGEPCVLGPKSTATLFHTDRINACARRLDHEDARALLLVVCNEATQTQRI